MVKYGVRAVFCGHNHIYWHQPKTAWTTSSPAAAAPRWMPSPRTAATCTMSSSRGRHASSAPDLAAGAPGSGLSRRRERARRPVAAGLGHQHELLRGDGHHLVLHVAAPPAGQALAASPPRSPTKRRTSPASRRSSPSRRALSPARWTWSSQATLPKARTAEIFGRAGAEIDELQLNPGQRPSVSRGFLAE